MSCMEHRCPKCEHMEFNNIKYMDCPKCGCRMDNNYDEIIYEAQDYE